MLRAARAPTRATRFLLDGQTAVVDDYLEVRPEAEERLRALVAAGRLAIGPWLILDGRVPRSGETIVRDLQLGLARAAELGGAMHVGYLPDMFGHVAQMPQLLRAGRLRARRRVARRARGGRPHAFWWEAPDGSTVRAEYLPDGLRQRGAPARRAGQLARGRRARASAAARSSATTRFSRCTAPTTWPLPRRRPRRRAERSRRLGDARRTTSTARPRRTELTALARRAALRGAREPAHGRHVGPDRPEGGVRARRAGARALRRAAAGALRRRLARAAPGARPGRA